MDEICKIEVTKADLQKISEAGIEYNLKTVDVPDFDYSEDEAWVKLRHESLKAYKKVKEREFQIRHKMI